MNLLADMHIAPARALTAAGLIRATPRGDR
jgi:hypothetical protein